MTKKIHLARDIDIWSCTGDSEVYYSVQQTQPNEFSSPNQVPSLVRMIVERISAWCNLTDSNRLVDCFCWWFNISNEVDSYLNDFGLCAKGGVHKVLCWWFVHSFWEWIGPVGDIKLPEFVWLTEFEEWGPLEVAAGVSRWCHWIMRMRV